LGKTPEFVFYRRNLQAVEDGVAIPVDLFDVVEAGIVLTWQYPVKDVSRVPDGCDAFPCVCFYNNSDAQGRLPVGAALTIA
jgi:hypothetical protein